MQGSQIRTPCMRIKTGVWVLCAVFSLSIYSLNDERVSYLGAKAAEKVKQLSNSEQLQLGDGPACARVHRGFGCLAAASVITGARERRDPECSDVTGEGGAYWFDGRHTFPVGTHTNKRFLHRLNPTRDRDNCGTLSKELLQTREAACTSSVQQKRALKRKKQFLRAFGKVYRSDNREARNLQNAAPREERELQPKEEWAGQLYQQPSKHPQRQQEQQRQQLVARDTAGPAEENRPSDQSSRNELEAEDMEEVLPSRANDNRPGRTGGRQLLRAREDDFDLEAVGQLAEFLVKKQTAEAVLENEWKLIEESWKRADLFHKDVKAFSDSGFRYHRHKDGRSVIQAVLPFWKVDLPGALEDMAKTAAWRVFGAPAASATRPLRLNAANGGNDAFVHIGYSPSSQRNTYTFGWNDTQITYSTGVDPTEAWSLERVGGNVTDVPVGHMMEITSRNGGAKAFHDLSSRFYGHEVNVGDVHLGLTHQFYNDTYNATPSNIIVKGQDYSVDIGADPTDTSYRVGVGNDETMVTVRRDFDERRTAFQGDIMDWAVSLNTDAQDAGSSSLSAEAAVGIKDQEPFLTANVYRGAEEDYAEGDTQIQMNDIGMRLHWREEGLIGNITLGKIKYRFDMKEGLPDFTLTAS